MNKKRKYTKGPAWFKAHSPKALAARKVKLVREKKELTDLKGNNIPARWPNGYCVYHVDSLSGPMYRIMASKISHGSYEYSLIVDTPDCLGDGKIRNCMERELVSCREREHILRNNTDKVRGALNNRDLQIGVLKDKLHEAEGRSAAYMGHLDTARKEIEQLNAKLKVRTFNETEMRKRISELEAKLERTSGDSQMEVENAVHNYRELQGECKRLEQESKMYHDACQEFSTKLARYKAVVELLLNGK